MTIMEIAPSKDMVGGGTGKTNKEIKILTKFSKK